MSCGTSESFNACTRRLPPLGSLRLSMNRSRSSGWQSGFVFVLTVTLLVDVLLVLAGTHPGIYQMAAPLFGIAVVTASGLWLLGLAGVTAVAAIPAAFVVGASAAMLAMLAIAELFNVVAQQAFLIWAACLVAIWLAFPRLRRFEPASVAWIDVGATAGLSLLIAYFGKEMAAFLPAALQDASMPAWSDYFVHGTTIASFGDPLAIGQGNILLANVHRPPYHYGSYMLAAGLQPSSGLPGLGLALATMQPLSLLVGGLGLYALVAQLSGRAIALIALLCIACLPDPSRYWMHNGFYGFHWLLYAAPGSGYAIGAGMLSALCLREGVNTRRWAPHVLALFLLASVSMIRLHMFVLLAPAMAGMWLLAIRRSPSGRDWPVVLGCFGLLFFGAVALLAWRADLRELLHSLRYVKEALGFGPPRFLDFYHQQESWMPTALQLVLVVVLALMLGLAGFSVMLPVASVLWTRAHRWEMFDWFPWALCGSYALLILLAPTWLNTDASELKHRHFLLLYAAVGGWSVARALQLVTYVRWTHVGVERIALAVFAIVIALVMVLGREAEPGRPDGRYIPWASKFYQSPNEPGLARAGAYLHGHAEPGDLLIMGGQAMRGYVMSRQTELVSVSDIAAYIGRVELLEKQGGNYAAIAAQRSADMGRVEAAGSWAEACGQLRSIGVRWYVENQPGLPRWDIGRAQAVLKAGDFGVYDAGTKAQSRCERPVVRATQDSR